MLSSARWPGNVLGATALLLAAAAAAPALAGPGAGAGAAISGDAGAVGAGGWVFWADVLEEYRFQSTSAATTAAPADPQGNALVEPLAGESDHDARLFLTAGTHCPLDILSAELSLGIWSDLDGSVPQGEPSGVASIYDRSSPPIWFDVFTLNARYRPGGVVDVVRAGRQQTEHGLPSTFDGAYARFNVVERRLQLFAFGGRTAHFFEVDAAAFEDWIVSAGAIIRPMHELKLELEYRFLLEDTVRTENLTDHTYGVKAQYRPAPWAYVRAGLRGIDDRLSHARAGASFTWDELEMGLDLDAAAQIVSLREQNERDDPYYLVLGESLANLRSRLDLWKALSTEVGTYTFHVGWGGRFLLGADPTAFNRNVNRWHLMIDASDIVVHGPYASAVVEQHLAAAGDGEDSSFLALGGTVGYRARRIKAEVGSSYQRYAYSYYRTLEERTDVRTVFCEVRWKPMSWLWVRARYELQVFDRDLHILTLAVGQSYGP